MAKVRHVGCACTGADEFGAALASFFGEPDLGSCSGSTRGHGHCRVVAATHVRGYHLLSMRVGFAISQFLGRVALTLFFIFILTPVGLLLRLAGKDLLQLKRPAKADTFWQTAKNLSPLDRLF
jgi:hypothetical protein